MICTEILMCYTEDFSSATLSLASSWVWDKALVCVYWEKVTSTQLEQPRGYTNLAELGWSWSQDSQFMGGIQVEFYVGVRDPD